MAKNKRIVMENKKEEKEKKEKGKEKKKEEKKAHKDRDKMTINDLAALCIREFNALHRMLMSREDREDFDSRIDGRYGADSTETD